MCILVIRNTKVSPERITLDQYDEHLDLGISVKTSYVPIFHIPYAHSDWFGVIFAHVAKPELNIFTNAITVIYIIFSKFPSNFNHIVLSYK